MTGQGPGAQAGGWTRLDRRTLVAEVALVVGPLVPVAAAALLLGRGLQGRALVTVGLAAAVALVVVGVRVTRLLTSRYRVGPEVVEVRSGLLHRTSRAVPRERVRSVDLTATALRRLLGLTVVRIGTGQSFAGTELKPLTLDAVAHATAEGLRRVLLVRAGGGTDDEGPGAARTAERTGELVRLDPAWVRYAPVSVTGVAGVWLLLGAVYKALELVDVDLLEGPLVARTAAALGERGVGTAIVVMAAAVVTLGAIGSVVLFTEAWWSYRLTREPDRSLRIVRGLLTRRSISLEQDRLRGVELREPLTLRPAGAGEVRAVATGLSRGQGAALVGSAVLAPPMPVTAAAGVAALALGTPVTPVGPGAVLRRHPRAALRRRLIRAALVVGPPVVAAGTAVALGAPPPVWVWVLLAVAALAAGALAVDAAAALGHGLVGPFLVVRSGTLVRSTVALERAGVIGWRLARSPTQRRYGLCTLIATSAAGRGYFPARDLDEASALRLAREAVPGLLEPFLLDGPGHPTAEPAPSQVRSSPPPTRSGRLRAGSGSPAC